MTPYDSPDYHALIRGIRERDRAGLDSTLARLVCADWLEERGEVEQADLIRIMTEIEAAQATGQLMVGSPAVDQMRRLRVRLFRDGTTPGAVYCDPWCAHDHEPGVAVLLLRCGAVARASCPLMWWLQHGPDLCRRHPVREVAVTNMRSAERWAESHLYQEESYIANQRGRTDLARLFTQLELLGHSLYRDPDADSKFIPAVNAAALLWAEAEADRQHTAATPSA